MVVHVVGAIKKSYKTSWDNYDLADFERPLASRGINIAPSTIIAPATPTLHQFIDGEFLSGSHAWPENVEEDRIDKVSGLSWDALKQNMWGSRS